MTTESYRGVVRGGTVVLRESGKPMAEGTEVLVTPVTDARGTPAAVLEAMETAPRVPTIWVDELEQLIAEGRRPPTRSDPFQEAL